MSAFPRIVSLIASSTEIVCRLGFGNHLVGRSHECDYPEYVRSLPVCTEVKFRTDGTSYDIDQRVKAILQESLSVYRVKAEVLNALRPDLIITQTQCEVCAVSLKDVEEAVCQLVDTRPEIVSLEPNDLNDVWADIRKVAAAVGAPERGEALVAELQDRIQAIASQAKVITWRPTVACIEWVDPLMAAGNWIPELVDAAGGLNLFGEKGKHSPWLSWDHLVELNPDILLIFPCGYTIERALQDLPILKQKPGWHQLRAVRNGRVFVCDGNQYFNRPGPRLVESLEILAEIFHPDRFHFGHEGSGWVRV